VPFVFVVPRIEAVLKDYAIPLPRFTILAIEASHRVISVGWLLLLLLPFLVVADWFVMHALSRRGDVEKTRFLSMLMIAIPLLMIALTAWALSQPLFQIDMGLRG